MVFTNLSLELCRCAWAGSDPLYTHYHDTEWGVPLRDDDSALFERICLEGAQAGLSWITILRKRENYRYAFDGFDPATVSRYDEAKITELMANAGIIRNRAKIVSAINNAWKTLAIQKEYGSLSDYLWGFVNRKTIQNEWRTLSEIPPQTDLSSRLSKDLKKRGFTFVGPTTCYAMMQATGMVNDHIVDCFRHKEVKQIDTHS
jgi:DNA-3-methyladenine glycosylase I